MLNQVTHWVEILGTAVDVLLLCRVLLLRLQRQYLFITLACVLAVLFDAAALSLRSDTQADFRVFLYSRFLYAIVYPMVAWDVFEEIKLQIAKLRRFAAMRLVSGLFFAVLFGLLMGAFVDSSDSPSSDSPVLITMALVLWAGASTAALAFLLTIHRVLRTQSMTLPNNTNVWLRYYELSFGAEALYCLMTVLIPISRVSWLGDTVAVVFMSFGIAITGWCIWKLRSLPSTALPAPENARLS